MEKRDTNHNSVKTYDNYDPQIYYGPQSDPDFSDSDTPISEPETSKPAARCKGGRKDKASAAGKSAKGLAEWGRRVASRWDAGTLKLVVGVALICVGAWLLVSLVSYLSNCITDASAVHDAALGAAVGVENAGGELGARAGSGLVDQGVGLGSVVIIIWTLVMGLKLLTGRPKFKTVNFTVKCLVALVTVSLIIGQVTIAVDTTVNWGGVHGHFVAERVAALSGRIGGVILCLFMVALFVVICLRDLAKWILKLKAKRDAIKAARREAHERREEKRRLMEALRAEEEKADAVEQAEESAAGLESEPVEPEEQQEAQEFVTFVDAYYQIDEEPEEQLQNPETTEVAEGYETKEAEMVVNVVQTAEGDMGSGKATITGAEGQKLPYKFPPIELLREGQSRISVDQTEQLENQELIRRTLAEFDIPILSIEATVGPTVTLYEIVPEKGVRIQKIRGLADDIALRLAATGVRIIAPIPGKGTIGIEVANKEPQTVSMRSVIKSQKFQEAKAELPIGLGATITSGTYVADLAKMPHLLVAGATGQGKSVGLNAIIASLLYSKTPDELKFVMVDPKQVEFSLYEKLSQHYLAAIPGTDEPIITDMKKVVATLSSLCVEMDERYRLLRLAHVRKITEYNEKFATHTLLPTDGHRFLPYIVVIVDEFADLIMMEGKSVETPIARLAQKARAVGIHVIIATQRPSTNVITGVIKANFPARIAFKVASGVDSKTILDSTGAQQLIGRGDMLISTNSETVRVQCAFIDTPEVEQLCDYIERQPYGSGPYQLPEPVVEGGEDVPAVRGESGGERDDLFEDAAKMVITTGKASTTWIQRRFGIGFSRAARITDQLEEAGVIGPQDGAKPRAILMDLVSLESIL